MNKLPKCKITVIKRSLNQDIIDGYMKEEMRNSNMCEVLKEGDEFFVYSEFHAPENFCQWAWADIRNDIIAVINGVQHPWFKEKGITISGCTDWFKPVLFKIEKIIK
ncbi:MAG: TIGR04076 family protein [Desulfobacteraceae bacterium]|nr:TIGR04076 family protein [Desulfobacteraceae bacterium]